MNADMVEAAVYIAGEWEWWAKDRRMGGAGLGFWQPRVMSTTEL